VSLSVAGYWKSAKIIHRPGGGPGAVRAGAAFPNNRTAAPGHQSRPTPRTPTTTVRDTVCLPGGGHRFGEIGGDSRPCGSDELGRELARLASSSDTTVRRMIEAGEMRPDERGWEAAG
jgi:hypothetical protein